MLLFYQDKRYKLTDQEAQVMFPKFHAENKRFVKVDYDPGDYINYKRNIYTFQCSMIDNVISGNRFNDVEFLKFMCGWNVKLLDDFNLTDFNNNIGRKVRQCICYVIALNSDVDLFDIIDQIDIRLSELELIIKYKLERQGHDYNINNKPHHDIINNKNGVRMLFRANSFLMCHWIADTRVIKILTFRDNIIVNKYSKFRSNYEPNKWI